MKTFLLVIKMMLVVSSLHAQLGQHHDVSLNKNDSNLIKLNCIDFLRKIAKDTFGDMYFSIEKTRLIDSAELANNILDSTKNDIWHESKMRTPYLATIYNGSKKHEAFVFIITFDSEFKAEEALYSLNLNINILQESRVEGLYYWDWQLDGKCLMVFFSDSESTFNPIWFYKFCNIIKYHVLFKRN